MIYDIIIKIICDYQGSTSPFKTFPFIFYDAESGAVQITFLFCLLAVRLDQHGELMESVRGEWQMNLLLAICVTTEIVHPHCGSWFWYQWLVTSSLLLLSPHYKIMPQEPLQKYHRTPPLEVWVSSWRECFGEILTPILVWPTPPQRAESQLCGVPFPPSS